MPPRAKGRDYFIARFWTLVDKQEGGCWLYTGHLTPTGYAHFYAGGGRGAPKPYVHRFSYELLVGPIPEGLDLDHLCRVRNCVNPAHLEPVTHRENVLRGDTVVAMNARKTHCPKGHPLDGINSAGRYCTTCRPKRDRSRCMRGHEFTEANTYWEPNGKGRACKTCRLRRTRESQARRRAS